MASLNEEILSQLNTLCQLVREGTAAPTELRPPPQENTTALMTDYDCMIICAADDVLGAIDRWNRSRKGRLGSR